MQLIPATAIAILVASGSTRPTAIVGTALLATLCAASVAIISVKLLEKLPAFRISPSNVSTFEHAAKLPNPVGRDSVEPTNSAGATDPGYSGSVAIQEPVKRLSMWGLIALITLVVLFIVLLVRMVAPTLFGVSVAPNTAAQNVFVRSVNALSILAIPFLLSFFPLYAAARGVKVYDEFVEGAKEGFGVILKIIPFLVTMLVAIGMFKGAGGIDLLSRLLSPILTPLQFPTDLLPLALMRPLSGSGTLALLTDIVHRLGPDNIVSLTAATIYGSTETTFYVAAVYFGAVGIKQTRHAIPAGLLADLTGVVASVIICRAVLG